eukprot:3468314-Alexandrium_andersonii.AAC.1
MHLRLHAPVISRFAGALHLVRWPQKPHTGVSTDAVGGRSRLEVVELATSVLKCCSGSSAAAGSMAHEYRLSCAARRRIRRSAELSGPGVQGVEPHVARELEARERAALAPAGLDAGFPAVPPCPCCMLSLNHMRWQSLQRS